MRILFVYSDQVAEWNCSEHRTAIPFRAMRRAGVSCETISLQEWERTNPLIDKVSRDADLIMVQRNLFGLTLNKIAYYKAMRKALVVDFDDAYHHMGLDTGSPSGDFWYNGKVKTPDGGEAIMDPPPLRSIEWGAKLAGAVSSPSQVILNDWMRFGVRTYLLPNYIEPWLYKWHDVYRDPGEIFIGGGGSMSHIKSWEQSGVVGALTKLVREDKRVHVVIAGDERVGKMFRFLPQSRVHKKGWLAYALYSRSLSYLDIGLIPLAGPYDDRRSFIKPVEYSAMGIPWVGSNRPPNNISIGTGVLVGNTLEEWYIALKATIDQLPERAKLSREIASNVKEFYSIDNNVDYLVSTYGRIIEESR